MQKRVFQFRKTYINQQELVEIPYLQLPILDFLAPGDDGDDVGVGSFSTTHLTSYEPLSS